MICGLVHLCYLVICSQMSLLKTDFITAAFLALPPGLLPQPFPFPLFEQPKNYPRPGHRFCSYGIMCALFSVVDLHHFRSVSPEQTYTVPHVLHCF